MPEKRDVMAELYRVYREVKGEYLWFAEMVHKVRSVEREAIEYLEEMFRLSEEAHNVLKDKLVWVGSLCVKRDVNAYMYLFSTPEFGRSDDYGVSKVFVKYLEVCGSNPEIVMLNRDKGLVSYVRVDMNLGLIALHRYLDVVKEMYFELVRKAEEVGKHNKEQYLMVKLMYS